jgi:hypothetical protein
VEAFVLGCLAKARTPEIVGAGWMRTTPRLLAPWLLPAWAADAMPSISTATRGSLSLGRHTQSSWSVRGAFLKPCVCSQPDIAEAATRFPFPHLPDDPG